MAWEPGRGGAEDRLRAAPYGPASALADPYRRSPAAAGRQGPALAGPRAGSTGPGRSGTGPALGPGALQPSGGGNENWLASYERSSQDFISQLQGLLGQVGQSSMEAEARAAPQAPAAPMSPLQPPLRTQLSQQAEAAVAAPAATPRRSALAAREAGVGSLAALAMSLDKEIAELLGGDPPIRPAQQPPPAQQPTTPTLAPTQPPAYAQPPLPPRASAQPLQARPTQQQAATQPSMPAPVPSLAPSSAAAAADKLADILREFGTGAGAPPAAASDAGPSEPSSSAAAAGKLDEPRAAPVPSKAAGTGLGTGSGANAGSTGTATTAAPAAAGAVAAAPMSLPPGAIGELWSVLQASKQNAARLAADLKAAQQEAEEAKERQQEADDLARMFQTQLVTRQQQLSSWTTAMVEMQEREVSAKEMLRTAQDRCTQLAQQAKQAQHVAVTAQLRLERILADQQKQKQEMQRLREGAAHAPDFQGSPASTWPRQSARSRPSQTGSEPEADAAGSSAGGASASGTPQAALDLRSLRADMAAAQSRATRAELELAVARNRAVMAQQELADEEARARRAATAAGAAQEELERTRAALELMGRDHDRLRAQLEELRQQLRGRDEAEARRATEAAVQAAKAAVSTLMAAGVSTSRGHAVPRSFDSPTSAGGNVLLPMVGAGGGWGAGSGAGTGSPLMNTLLSTGDMVAHGSATITGLASESVHHQHYQQQPQPLRQHHHRSSLERPNWPDDNRQPLPPPPHDQQRSEGAGIQGAATVGRGGPGPVSGGVSMLTLAQFQLGAESGAGVARDTPEVSSISYGYDNLVGSVSTSSSSAGGSDAGGDRGRGSATAVMARLGAAAAAAAAQKQGPAAPAGPGAAAGSGGAAVAAGGKASAEPSEHAAAADQPRLQATHPMPMPMPSSTWSGRRNSLLLVDPADLPGSEAGPPSRYSSQRRPSAAFHARKSQEEMNTPAPSPSGATAVYGRPSGNGKAVVAADDDGPEGGLTQYAGAQGTRARPAGLGSRGSVEGDAGSATRLRPALGAHQSMVQKPRHLVSPPRRASSHGNQAPVQNVAAGGAALAAGGGAVPGPEGLRTSGLPSVRLSAGAGAIMSQGGLASSVGTGRAMRMLLDASHSSGGVGGARSSIAISIGGGLTDEMVPLSRAPSSARRRLSFARSSTATGVGQRVGRLSVSGLMAAGASAGAAMPTHAAQAAPADTTAATQAWVNSVSRRSLHSSTAAAGPGAGDTSSCTTQQSPPYSPLPAVTMDPVADELLRRVRSAEQAWAAAAMERQASAAVVEGAGEHGEGTSAAVVQPHPTLAELRQQLAEAAGSRAPAAASAGTPSAGTRFEHKPTSIAPQTEMPVEVAGERTRTSSAMPAPPAARPSTSLQPPGLLEGQQANAAAAAANKNGGLQLLQAPDSGTAHGLAATPAAAEEQMLSNQRPKTLEPPPMAVHAAGAPALDAAAVAQQQSDNALGPRYKENMQLLHRDAAYGPTAHDNRQPRPLPPASLNDSTSTVTHGYDTVRVPYAAEANTAAAVAPASRTSAVAAIGPAQVVASTLRGGVPVTAAGHGLVPSSTHPYHELEHQQVPAEPYGDADADAAALMRHLVLTPRSRMLSPSQLDSYRVSTSLAASWVADSSVAGGDAGLSGSFAFGSPGPAGLLPSHAQNAPSLSLLQQQLGRGTGIGAGGGRPSGVLSPVAEQRALEARVVKAHGLDARLTPLRVLARSTSAGEAAPGESPGRSTTATAATAEHRSTAQRRGKPWWLRLLLSAVGRGGGGGAVRAARGASSSGSSSDSSERLPSYMRLDSSGKAPPPVHTTAPASPMHARLGTSSPYAVRDSRFTSPIPTVPTSPKLAPASAQPTTEPAITLASPSTASLQGRSSDARSARQRGVADKGAAKGARRNGVGGEVQRALVNAAVAAGGVAVGVALVLGVAGWAERMVERRRARMDSEEAPGPACGCEPKGAPRREARGPQEVAEIEEGRAGVQPGREW
ncbi:hypothetical protein HXX76_012667 [Chlamydomonas incerta]|uniref:Uncharacterized protein n=1 Tax=Chlamydomonas incerta TaxID=51695 RepID=A0A835VT54_CHLIN|nr:hypothetical protein HXX76_012667 [Chlamydomonas incerta]|eukprot:KAG2426880.1 hypothetical protein HXX76_012667 [Chlamydomonas incerta]